MTLVFHNKNPVCYENQIIMFLITEIKYIQSFLGYLNEDN